MNAFEALAQNWLDLLKSYKELFLLEFKLARHSLIPVFFLAMLFVVASSAFVQFLLFLTFYLIYHSTHEIFIALSIAGAISIFILGIVMFLLWVYFNQLKFNHFRRQLKNLKSSHEVVSDDQTTKKRN